MRLLYLALIGLAPAATFGAPFCTSTSIARVRDPAGITFNITRTDCDTLAKDSAVSVTARRDGRNESVLLLKYDPWADEVPSVYVRDGESIFIHVFRASSILEQISKWGSYKITVTIDKIAYPDRREIT
jgi:hypothetical protein